MSTREIPVSYEHECDGCGDVQRSTSKSRPSHWSLLTLAQDAYDYTEAMIIPAYFAHGLWQTGNYGQVDAPSVKLWQPLPAPPLQAGEE